MAFWSIRFYTDAADNTLPAVTTLLEELEQEADVRPALEQRFCLQDTLQDIGRTNVNQVRLTTDPAVVPIARAVPPPQAVATL